MKTLRLGILTAAVLLLIGAFGSRADAGDQDITFCCAQVNDLTSSPAPTPMMNPFIPRVLGCKAIDGDRESIGSCTGVVLGCADGPLACQPSRLFPGLLDCSCNSRAAVAF